MHDTRTIVVSNEANPRLLDKIEIMPWREFLKSLWNGDII